MSHTTLKLIPGVDQNRTLALNEAAISYTNLVRFVPDKQGLGLVQKLGGWTQWFRGQLYSTVRALWAWEDTNALAYLGVGSQTTIASILTASCNGTLATITYSGSSLFQVGSNVIISGISVNAYNTPVGTSTVVAASGPNYIQYTLSGSHASVSNPDGSPIGALSSGDGLGYIAANANTSFNIITPRVTFSTNSPPDAVTTAGSSQVRINNAGSNVSNFDSVYIKTQISVGGLILFGSYPCTYIDGANSYFINAKNIIGSPVAATTTVPPGTAASVPIFTFAIGDQTATVTLPNNGYSVGDTFPIIVPLNFGTTTLYGNYIVSSIIDTNNFKISLKSIPNSSVIISISGNGTTTGTFTYSGVYNFNVNDHILISNYTGPASQFNTPSGQYAKILTIDNVYKTVTFQNSNGSIFMSMTESVQQGSAFINQSYLNNGNAYYEYLKTPGPTPSGGGYGNGYYGDGLYGTGTPGQATVAVTGSPIAAVDWTLDNWGEILVACPIGGPIYNWSPTGGNSVASVMSNGPMVNDGMFVAMPQRQIVAWGSTFNGIQDPLLIRWCDVNNYGSWVATVTNQAGSYRLPKGSKVVGCIQGPQQGLIWTDLGIWAMQYVGPPYVYQFNEIGNGCGLISRKAAASMNGVVYWMSQSQFYRLSGTGVEVIRCPVWDVIFQDFDTSETALNKIRIAVNSQFGEISWYYATKGSNGEISNYVKYNAVLDQWDFGTLSRTAWINQSVLGPPIGASGTNYIYQHETSPDADGQPLYASFQTGYFQISDAEYKVFVDQVWPDMKYGYYGGSNAADLVMTFYVTDYPEQTPKEYPFNINVNTTFVTPRFRGRLMSIKLETAPGDVGSFWRLGAIRYRLQPDGKF